MRRVFLTVVIAATLLIVVVSLVLVRGGGEAFVAHGPLPPPPSGSLAFAGVPSQHPFQKDASGALVRTVFETDGPGDTRFEVRDLLIPPRGKSELRALPGPAIIELATGSAKMSLGEKAEALVLGTEMKTLAAGTSASIENSGPIPAMLRLYVIRAR
jgi:hypothetical protein